MILNDFSKVFVGIIVLLSVSTGAFSANHDIVLKKEHGALSPLWLKKNDNKVNRKVYEVNHSSIPALKAYIKETNELFKLKKIDFDTIRALNPELLSLAYNGTEAGDVKAQYNHLIRSVQQVIDDKIARKHQAIRERELLSQNYEAQLITLANNQRDYRAMVQGVYDLKEQIITKQALSKEAVKEHSSQLSKALNQHSALNRVLQDNHFERPKMRAGACKQNIVTKPRRLEVAYTVQNFCFSSKISVVKDSAEALAGDSKVMSAIKNKLMAIGLEKIRQGNTFNKPQGQPGYTQEIKGFSHGGIESVKKAAKEKYGHSERGFGFAIKKVEKKLASNNYQITYQKQRVNVIPKKELIHSTGMKALKPLSNELDRLISKYFAASFVNAINESVNEFITDHALIELEESENIYLVRDSYETDTQIEVEYYLVNPKVLLENPAIKKHFDGKKIPVTAAAKVGSLVLWRGRDVNHSRIARRLVDILSTK
ncbi:hypothetical protein [Psychrobium sp. 1_MG-2023]|uniref:hypothetical protein n=1 Tax=Psychrobium sp. 1_MG-2023 TaxID=3062624 RepID=UPI000C31DC56|nr:hypothetical protein [Psychrobium sp. 1_MG-2023]MDP2559628.1 hypothetical protein [Psychrobium sp. 1_MG-2023]PKF59461.1 hypothetical protein CW748_01435 [Alteromonadales bacterium alter-6D02]